MRKWKRFKTAANIPRTGCTKKLTRRSDCATLRQTTRNPRARHETPQASLSMLKVKLMTVQLENSLYGRDSRRKPRLSTFNMAAQLRFAELYLNKPQTWPQTPHTSFFSSQGTWTPGTYWINHWVTQQDNDPKHNSKSTTGWVKFKNQGMSEFVIKCIPLTVGR